MSDSALPYQRARLLAGTFVVSALSIAALGNPWSIPLATVSSAVAITLLWWPRSRSWLPALTGISGAVSLLVTMLEIRFETLAVPPSGMVESLLLCVLVGLLGRFSPPASAIIAGVLAALAVATSIYRVAPGEHFEPLSGQELFYAAAFWALGPIGAAIAGVYLRYVENRRQRAIADAQHDERLRLAHDLHDYVAHDISGMIAQAQAAQVVIDSAAGGTRDAVLKESLARIETAGIAAMTSMDRTVSLLRATQRCEDNAPAIPVSLPGLAELPDLMERFATSVTAQVTSVIEVEAHEVPREIGSTVYRLIVEALTNVRRHAPTATDISVAVTNDFNEVVVVVENNAGGLACANVRPRGGVGLPSLNERTEALAGRLTAGPTRDGWRLEARLPLEIHTHRNPTQPTNEGKDS
ncbi:sensor histidine kinase [Natronoglycomyces albus]|uniref:histidine kinase n=1 Tax=Natronoglycomyces albus TaxID=2811108 RepID=A0A895XN95_9ACTN|nr:histidine kinase [Natronoglycomyces albus]QSB03946.1 hypothetical protein JQS30_08920 [Natronoglycomyces albus]